MSHRLKRSKGGLNVHQVAIDEEMTEEDYNRTDTRRDTTTWAIAGFLYIVLAGTFTYLGSTVVALPVIATHWVVANATSASQLRDSDGVLVQCELGALELDLVGDGLNPVWVSAGIFYFTAVVFLLNLLFRSCGAQYATVEAIDPLLDYSHLISYMLTVLVCSELAGHVGVIELTLQASLALSALCFLLLGLHERSTRTGRKIMCFLLGCVFETINWGLILASMVKNKESRTEVTVLVSLCITYYVLIFLIQIVANICRCDRFIEGHITTRRQIQIFVQFCFDVTIAALIYKSIT
jgi:hypothetical protein